MFHGLTLLVACTLLILVRGATIGKGSDSSNAEKSGESEEYEEANTDEAKKAGVQHKFWMPTYEGTNPLNRRKISITSSEIEKYDHSVDVSLSGVNKNRTRNPRKENKPDISHMPLLWKGDRIDRNTTESLPVLDSKFISLESDNESEDLTSLNNGKSNSSSYPISHDVITKKVTIQDKRKKPVSKPKSIPTAKNQTDIETKTLKKSSLKENQSKLNNAVKTELLEKGVTSQFFNELDRITSDETKLAPEYYKKIVKTATENTKKKLGYHKNEPKIQQHSKIPSPEIIAVDVDSKPIKRTIKGDDITFITRHNQFKEKPKDEKLKEKSKKKSLSEVNKENRVKGLEKELLENSEKTNLYSNSTSLSKNSDDDRDMTREKKVKPLIQKLFLQYNEDSENKINQTEKIEDSFTEFCDYSAWSDVLSRNKTQRKQKKRKPKPTSLPESYDTSSTDLRKWPGKNIKKKADMIRQKERTNKRLGDIKEKPKKKQSKGGDYDYQKGYDDYDYPRKKIRMRTKGEKQYAVKEVKGYLKEMDQKYGGRPGVKPRRGRGRSGERERDRSYERGFRTRDRERRKGRDYGYKRRTTWDGEERGGRRSRGEQRYNDRGYRDDREYRRGEQRYNDRGNRDDREYRRGSDREYGSRGGWSGRRGGGGRGGVRGGGRGRGFRERGGGDREYRRTEERRSSRGRSEGRGGRRGRRERD